MQGFVRIASMRTAVPLETFLESVDARNPLNARELTGLFQQTAECELVSRQMSDKAWGTPMPCIRSHVAIWHRSRSPKASVGACVERGPIDARSAAWRRSHASGNPSTGKTGYVPLPGEDSSGGNDRRERRMEG